MHESQLKIASDRPSKTARNIATFSKMRGNSEESKQAPCNNACSQGDNSASKMQESRLVRNEESIQESKNSGNYEGKEATKVTKKRS